MFKLKIAMPNKKISNFLDDQCLFQFFVTSSFLKRLAYAYAYSSLSLSMYILTRSSKRETRVALLVIPLPLRFMYPQLPSSLLPLGKCWRLRVAPTDLTIDKDAFPDLLSPERRKEMSCSSHDKYLNGEELSRK